MAGARPNGRSEALCRRCLSCSLPCMPAPWASHQPCLPRSLPPPADVNRKGRYPPLQALVPRLGAARLLALQPGLVPVCLDAMSLHLISSSIAGFLLALLAQLQREEQQQQQHQQVAAQQAGQPAAAAVAVDSGDAGWRAGWLPALAAALRDGSEAQRDHVTAHLLPHLLSLDPPALGLLLHRLLPGGDGAGDGTSGSGASSEGAAAACLALLKAARKQQLLSDLDALPIAGLGAAAVRSTLLAAVRSSSEGLR